MAAVTSLNHLASSVNQTLRNYFNYFASVIDFSAHMAIYKNVSHHSSMPEIQGCGFMYASWQCITQFSLCARTVK